VNRPLPRAFGLIGGVAAAASQPRFGHWWRTFGSRAFGRPRVGVWAKAGNGVTEAGIEARSRKARHRQATGGGPGREE